MNVFEELTDDEDFLELVEAIRHPRRPQIFRNRPNHFEMWHDVEFKARFRLDKPTVRFVIDSITEIIMNKVEKNHALTPEMKVFVTLRYLATGSILQVVGDLNGIDKSTACRVVKKVLRAIAGLAGDYISFPNSPAERQEIRKIFFNISRFPRCIGALDCTHVRIVSPGGPQAENYRNRKGFFSYNVQVICDSKLNIRNIVCRWPGSAHDANIFRNSVIRAQFERGEFQGDVLLGDRGYGVKPYLITPLSTPTTPVEHLFNEAQIRTRNPIERCFGVWKRRFPVLALGIRLKIDKVESVVIASAVLHNIACMMRDADPPIAEEIEAAVNFVNDVQVNIVQGAPGGQNNSVRHSLINDYFANLV